MQTFVYIWISCRLYAGSLEYLIVKHILTGGFLSIIIVPVIVPIKAFLHITGGHIKH